MTLRPTDGPVWITGASSGIGRALALILAKRGWSVFATARSEDALASLASEVPHGQIIPMAADVTDPDAMAATVAAITASHGPIACAVLNAGIYLPVRHAPFEREAYEKSFAVNLNGTINGLAPLIDQMVPRRSGAIYIVSSVAGYSGLPTSAAYGATKAALINMAESLKFDLDNHGVHIGVINPGFVRTPATDSNPFP
ncbi:MAG: SDR family NAD(P)-dependent oxidoreductase, partial [Pseudomonadota bacterium]